MKLNNNKVFNHVERVLYFLYRRLFNNKTKKDINNIAIIIYIPKTSKKYNNWNDGFTKAIEMLEGRYSFSFFNLAVEEPTSKELNKFDLVLIKSNWGWIPDKFIRGIKLHRNVKKGLLISGVGNPPSFFKNIFYDILFYETYWYKNKILRHPNIVHAFGIDTSLMFPEKETQTIDILSVGAIRKYKRLHKLIDKPGNKLIIGDTEGADSELLKTLKNNNIKIVNFIPYKKLRSFYNKSKTIYIPANIGGGGERAVLEARACNKKVMIEPDNIKLKELCLSPIYNHHYYANKINLGILSLSKSEVSNFSKQIKSTKTISVGIDSFHNGNLIIKGDQNVTIGCYCAFGQNVKIITSNHDYAYIAVQGTIYNKAFNSKHPGELNVPPNKTRTKGDVWIGSDVWIGDNVIILSGVKIGNGVCIGAGSIVTKNISDFSLVGGVPAKELGKRFSENIISKILNDPWWDWSFSKIKQNKDVFFSNLRESDEFNIL